jgi:hypothetical protein
MRLGIAVQELLGQEEQILRPRAQGGQGHHHHGQAMVQIRPEPPPRGVPPEIGGRGGDDLTSTD